MVEEAARGTIDSTAGWVEAVALGHAAYANLHQREHPRISSSRLPSELTTTASRVSCMYLSDQTVLAGEYLR